MLYRNQKTPAGAAAVHFLRGVVSDGQKFAAELHYAPLPEGLRERAEKQLELEKLPSN